ncbi:MAG: DUF2079 domain-containing protein [Candidatus Baltobacteraceae bacterium]|jgi:uncharacterized membrane protein
MRKLVVAFAVYVSALGAIALWRWHVWSWGADTGTFTQVISDAFGGFRDGPEQGTHFRFHWAPLLATLYPLVALTHSPLSLQFAQIVLIGSCVFPLAALARAYVPAASAARYAMLALLYPPLVGVAFTEFHEIAFFPVLALALFWAADRARWGWFALCAVAAALVREEACIVLAIVGLVLAALGLARRGSSRGDGLLAGEPLEPERLAVAGLGLAAVNLLALGVYYGILIPRVGPWVPSHFYAYAFAYGPVQLVLALLRNPAYLGQILTFGRFTYVLEALVPLAFLPFLSRWSLLAVPGMLALVLSSEPIAWRMGSHYPAVWIPYLLLGAVATLVRLERTRANLALERGYKAAVALCLLFLVAFNPTHVGHYLQPSYGDLAEARSALALVPPDAVVVTHDEWFVHIAYSHRKATTYFCPDVTYAVYADDFHGAHFQRDVRPQLEAEVRDGETRVVAAFGQVKVYRRRPGAVAPSRDCRTSTLQVPPPPT